MSRSTQLTVISPVMLVWIAQWYLWVPLGIVTDFEAFGPFNSTLNRPASSLVNVCVVLSSLRTVIVPTETVVGDGANWNVLITIVAAAPVGATVVDALMIGTCVVVELREGVVFDDEALLHAETAPRLATIIAPTTSC